MTVQAHTLCGSIPSVTGGVVAARRAASAPHRGATTVVPPVTPMKLVVARSRASALPTWGVDKTGRSARAAGHVEGSQQALQYALRLTAGLAGDGRFLLE